MLLKNVYLLYAPGHCGSYVNWAINISDLDSRAVTVPDPINTTVSTKFGGLGTSHHHIRIPSHQPYRMTVNWMLLNRPKDPKVYIINETNSAKNSAADFTISQILQHDPQGIIIAITNQNDWKITSYGYINGILKWPTRIFSWCKLNEIEVPFDPFDCADNQLARNWFVSKDPLLESSNPLNIDNVIALTKNYLDWYHSRNSLQPHEVNNKTYLDKIDINDRIFELNCLDICSDKFIAQFSNIMKQSGASDNFDLDYLAQFHYQYCKAQKNLQWFDSINEWLLTGKLDEYLLSHSCIEACVIKHIFNELELSRFTEFDPSWIQYYYNNIKGQSWPFCSNERQFYLLPDQIKMEMIEKFSYQPLNEKFLDPVIMLRDNWEHMSTQQINQIYKDLLLL